MNLLMPCIDAHPAPGEEVMAMDDASCDVDVNVDVRCVSINRTSDRRERMSEDE